jgi:hypothetical protein
MTDEEMKVMLAAWLMESPPLDPAPSGGWQEQIITEVLELIFEGREGTVRAVSPEGFECIVKVAYVPSIGLVPISEEKRGQS